MMIKNKSNKVYLKNVFPIGLEQKVFWNTQKMVGTKHNKRNRAIRTWKLTSWNNNTVCRIIRFTTLYQEEYEDVNWIMKIMYSESGFWKFGKQTNFFDLMSN